MSDDSAEKEKTKATEDSADGEDFESDNTVEQQQLTQIESENRTIQQRIMEKYNHDKLLWISVGFWSKVVVEYGIIAVPIFLFGTLSLAGLNYTGFTNIPYGKLWIFCVLVSGTLLQTVWCFTEGGEQSENQEPSG